jgi:hypothetical protein
MKSLTLSVRLKAIMKKTNSHSSLKKGLFICLLWWLLVPSRASAQTVPVGLPFFEEGLRRAQLMGRLDSNVSFTIRPIHPIHAFGRTDPYGLDAAIFPTDTNVYGRYTDWLLYLKKDSTQYRLHAHQAYQADGKATYRPKKNWHARLTLLPIYTHTRFNQHHPYGWSDGPMIPNRGLQQYISGGVYLKLGPIEAQYRPEFVWAQNRDFQNPPYRARNIDMPDRMGTESFRETFRGQSFVKVKLGAMSAGFSNENLWWGPGVNNAIIMSNNAPGFGHFTFHTNKPVVTPYGSFEMQMVMAKLRYSGFYPYPTSYDLTTWPPVAKDVLRDTTLKTPFHSFVNATVITFQPKFAPGLFLGASRVVQVKGETERWQDYFRVLYLDPRGEQTYQGPDEDGLNRNQLISLFGRLVLPQAHAELYYEIGREDFWWDMEDLITNPEWSTAWMGGFKKLYPLAGKDHWLEIHGEITKIQAPAAGFSRGGGVGYSFYTHSNQVGWTHRGQVLGAGIGPGSNMNVFGINYGKGFTTLGFSLDRVAYNEDMLYFRIQYLKLNPTANPFFIDDSKHFVDWGMNFKAHTAHGRVFMGYQLHILRTYNFQWNYDPFGAPGPFRFPGINVWSMNINVSCVYRF